MIRIGCFSLLILVGLGFAALLHAVMRDERAKLAKEVRLLADARPARIAEAAGPEAVVPGPVRIGGRVVADAPLKLSTGAGERLECAYTRVKLVQHYTSTDSKGNPKKESGTIHQRTEAAPCAIDDGSGPRLRLDLEAAKVFLKQREVVPLPAPAGDRLEYGDGSFQVARRKDDRFEAELEWLPVGATVLAVGLVAEGAAGPELAAPPGEPMLVSAYGEVETRKILGEERTVTYWVEGIGYAIGGFFAFVGVVGLIVTRRRRSAPPPPPSPFHPPPAPPPPPPAARGFEVS